MSSILIDGNDLPLSTSLTDVITNVQEVVDDIRLDIVNLNTDATQGVNAAGRTALTNTGTSTGDTTIATINSIVLGTGAAGSSFNVNAPTATTSALGLTRSTSAVTNATAAVSVPDGTTVSGGSVTIDYDVTDSATGTVGTAAFSTVIDNIASRTYVDALRIVVDGIQSGAITRNTFATEISVGPVDGSAGFFNRLESALLTAFPGTTSSVGDTVNVTMTAGGAPQRWTVSSVTPTTVFTRMDADPVIATNTSLGVVMGASGLAIPNEDTTAPANGDFWVITYDTAGANQGRMRVAGSGALRNLVNTKLATADFGTNFNSSLTAAITAGTTSFADITYTRVTS